ncbi:MAG: Flp pilus assembly complex ATPase component TadA [Elusimicrobia bacterium]|nr:Flp pilus assembly complex ATPase component TadA [Elusimicrobiota bacterium]
MAQIQKLRIGDILTQSRIITPEQLQQALKAQKQGGMMLGEAIVKLGFATEEAIAIAISKQIGVPYASRENKILKVERSQNLERIVNEKYSRDNLLLPLFLDDKLLAVAMADPDNMMVLDNLKLMTGYEITPFIATKAQILKAIDEFYSGGQTNLIDKAMEDKEGGDEEGVQVDTVGSGSDARVDLDKVLVEAKGSQVITFVNAMLKQAIAERGSDIHLEAYDERVTLRFRIDGILYERMPPPKDLFPAIVSRIKILSKLDIAEKRLPQDGAITMKLQNRNIDLRVSICPTVFGEKVVMRVLDKGSATLNIDKLGLEARQREDLLKAANLPHGLLFITGPTGSGKTTTLYTVLNTIKSPEVNIMTIEDPVEFKLDGINQVQIRPNIGLTFASALRSFLRQDPDIILVGEVRDPETAEICVKAALTGHLVLSTLHTNSALEAIPRLVDLGIEPFLLSSGLFCVAAQRLVRALCPACKRPYRPDAKEIEACMQESMLNPFPNPQSILFYKEGGCDKCARTGFLGRRAIYEIFFINNELKEVIYKHGGDVTLLRQVAAKSGAWNMRASAWRKVLEGVTSVHEALSVTSSNH